MPFNFESHMEIIHTPTILLVVDHTERESLRENSFHSPHFRRRSLHGYLSPLSALHVMSFSMIDLLQIASMALSFGFLVLALIYAISRTSDGSSAKRLAVMGLTIMLVTHAGSYIFSFWLGRSGNVTHSAIAVSVYSLASSLSFICALWMLIAAVFTRRAPVDHVERDDHATHDGEERIPTSSENPYSSPRS